MVRLTRIYTKSGDKGQTSLGNGARVPKHALRVEAYGTVDEANAVVGLARLATAGDAAADAMLARIQNDLFDLGADLCTPVAEGEQPGQALRVTAEQVARLEAEIDAMNAELEPLNSFILPGGSPAAAHLHVARTVIRRAERLIAALAEVEPLSPQAMIYANRLSDHFFVMARHLNQRGKADVLWLPGGNR
ncbi:MAG: cob(I)yrinic acid a,c-diamide adenosyltransferase [Bacteroidota bacterium]